MGTHSKEETEWRREVPPASCRCTGLEIISTNTSRARPIDSNNLSLLSSANLCRITIDAKSRRAYIIPDRVYFMRLKEFKSNNVKGLRTPTNNSALKGCRQASSKTVSNSSIHPAVSFSGSDQTPRSGVHWSYSLQDSQQWRQNPPKGRQTRSKIGRGASNLPRDSRLRSSDP